MTATGERAGTTASTPPPPARRFTGLLPRALLRWRRPVWWQEIAVLAVGYWLYTLGRNAIPDQRVIALRHARSIQHLQDSLHLNFELSFNHWVDAHEWFAQICDYYYATVHFIVPLVVLVWLFFFRTTVYRGARTVVVLASLLGLLCFALFPTAPPRLLAGYGYIDTVTVFHTWGSLADPQVAEHSNQFAAMPSLHIVWAAWAGITIFRCARWWWVRTLGLLYPCATFVVIIGTANHFVLDAVGGALLLALVYGLQYLMSGHGAYTPPVDAPQGNGPRRSREPDAVIEEAPHG